MKTRRHHLNDINFALSALGGKTEGKTKNGRHWLKVAHGRVFKGKTRTDVRNQAKAVAS